jgi:WD40 repeat protein
MKQVLALVVCVGALVALPTAKVVRAAEGPDRQQGDDKQRREYLADMSAAAQALGRVNQPSGPKFPPGLGGTGAAGPAPDGKELAEVRRLLKKWLPAAKGDADYRAWEWYFLDAQCREVSFYVKGHDSPVQAVAWSAGGDKLASADRKGVVKVWNVAGGKDQPEYKMTAPAAVVALGWSADGKLAIACQATVQVWEPGSGRAARTLPDPDKDSKRPVARVGTAAQHTLFDTWMTSVAWSPDSSKLALADANGKVKMWDMSADEQAALLGTHEGGAHSLAWSPNGTRLASVGGDGAVKIWDPARRKLVTISSECKPQRVWAQPSYALTWSNNGRYLEVVSAEGDLHVLDEKSGKQVRLRRLERPDALTEAGFMTVSISRFVWAPGGKLLASVAPSFGPFSSASDLKIWDVEKGREVLSLPGAWSIDKPPLVGQSDEATGCAPAFDGSGRRLAVGTDMGVVRTWDVGPGRRPVRNFLLSPFDIACTWSADSRQVFCTTDITLDDLRAVRKKHRDWEEANNKQPGIGIGLPPPGPAFPPLPGQSPLAAEVPNPHLRIQVYDAVTGEVAHTWDTKEKYKLDKVAASPDGQWLAGATGDGLLQLWSAKGGGLPRALEKPPKPAPSGPRSPIPGPAGPNKSSSEGLVLCWAPDSKLLAHATGRRKAIRLWDANTGKFVRLLKGEDKPLRWLAWSPDKEGKLLAAADDEGTVTVWDVASGKPAFSFKYTAQNRPAGVGPWGEPFASSVLSWGPDGKRLAVAGEDETIKVWDVDKKEELTTLRGGPAKGPHQVVCAVAWSPDGRRLAASSPDETFLLYDTTTWKEVLALRPVSAGTFATALVPAHVGTLAWSPDGAQLALFGRRGNITIWDARPQDK